MRNGRAGQRDRRADGGAGAEAGGVEEMKQRVAPEAVLDAIEQSQEVS